MPDFSHFLLANLAITLGAVLQAATGLGAGLMIVPMLALISLQFLPAPVILASMFLSALMAWKGRRVVEWNHVPSIFASLIAGSLLAVAVLSRLPLERMNLVFGLLILAGVAISVAGLRIHLNHPNAAVAGFSSGFMGTLSGFGAPPLALLYQHHPAPVMRASLAALYFITSPLILLLLWWSGHFGMQQVWIGLGLAPGYVVGYWLAKPLARFFDKGYARPAVLIFSTVAALLLIARGL